MSWLKTSSFIYFYSQMIHIFFLFLQRTSKCFSWLISYNKSFWNFHFNLFMSWWADGKTGPIFLLLPGSVLFIKHLTISLRFLARLMLGSVNRGESRCCMYYSELIQCFKRPQTSPFFLVNMRPESIPTAVVRGDWAQTVIPLPNCQVAESWMTDYKNTGRTPLLYSATHLSTEKKKVAFGCWV